MILRNLSVGQKFVCNGETYTKLNQFGEIWHSVNCKTETGIECHIDPKTEVALYEEKDEKGGAE